MRLTDDPWITLHGPRQPALPLVLDSPHSGTALPPGFACAVPIERLREGEDCFIDELWRPAAERGIPLLAAGFARTYLDVNRHAGDIDLELVAGGHWPAELRLSGKATLGKALVWRTLDDGTPIYAAPLTVAELQHRIASCHAPYHAALGTLLDAAHAAHGVVVHINCHSMNAVSGVMGQGGAGQVRPDIVLGDRDGSTCAPALTAQVRDFLARRGYQVTVNDPYKGVELVRVSGRPAEGRHSLQLELNKRLYMDEARRQPHAGFARVQADMMALLDHLAQALQSGLLP